MVFIQKESENVCHDNTLVNLPFLDPLIRENIKNKFEYLNTFNFRAPFIFAQEKCAKIKGARKRPIFAHSAARKLKGARNRNRSEHLETSI